MSKLDVAKIVQKNGIEIRSQFFYNTKLKPFFLKEVIIKPTKNSFQKIKMHGKKEIILVKEIAVYEKDTEKFICIAKPK